jgi:hypothetical protein
VAGRASVLHLGQHAVAQQVLDVYRRALDDAASRSATRQSAR